MELPAVIALRREPGHLVRSLTALLLRVGLGMTFLLAGAEKLQSKKEGNYPAPILAMFDPAQPGPDGKPKHFVVKLPPAMTELFARVLPYAEVGVGAALIVGFWTTFSAFLSGVLLLHLQFGQADMGQHDQMPGMLTYLLVNAGILWLSPVTSNYLSLDGLLFGWFWSPRSEGRYHDMQEETKLRATR